MESAQIFFVDSNRATADSYYRTICRHFVTVLMQIEGWEAMLSSVAASEWEPTFEYCSSISGIQHHSRCPSRSKPGL